jgi:chromosome segregation ATPase
MSELEEINKALRTASELLEAVANQWANRLNVRDDHIDALKEQLATANLKSEKLQQQFTTLYSALQYVQNNLDARSNKQKDLRSYITHILDLFVGEYSKEFDGQLFDVEALQTELAAAKAYIQKLTTYMQLRGLDVPDEEARK